MNPEFKGLNSVTFSVNGVKIGEGTTASVFNSAYTEEPVAIGRYEGSLTLTDVEISRDFLLGLGSMDITVSKGEYLPPRELRSKKKRMISKWKKKYTFNKETTTYKNCTIGGLN